MTQTAPGPAGAAGARLAWLDALRGIAALLVVWEHLSTGTAYLAPIRLAALPWVKAGDVGVFLFFLVSGYIIPASLEKRGSLRGFWISRAFRLYPLWAVVFGTVVILRHYDMFDPELYSRHHPISAFVAHATMLQDFLGVPDVLWVMWSLCYEMAFYLLVAGMFVFGVSRRSLEAAAALTALALVLGPVLPAAGLWQALGRERAVGVVAVLFLGGIAASVSGRRHLMRPAAGMLAVLALSLVARDAFAQAWEGLLILATMFVGTAVHRAHTGLIAGRRLAGAVAGLFVIAAVTGLTNTGGQTGPAAEQQGRRYVVSLAAAGALFCLGLLVRHRRIPRAMRWLGQISYSVYLLHAVLIVVLQPHIDDIEADHPNPALWIKLGSFVAFSVIVVAAAAVTHRLVERPAQQLGHRLGAWCERRFGSDAWTQPPADTQAGSRARSQAMSAA